MTTNINGLPKYTSKEEFYNYLTHGIGFVFSLGVLLFFLIKEIIEQIPFRTMFPFYIYALAMMMVFFVSTFYHKAKPSTKTKAVTRIIDHCDIYFFVAATYFPICVTGIENKAAAIGIMIGEISLMIIGILLNAIPNDSKKCELFAYIIYILQGWLLIFFFPFNIGIEFNVFLFILLGGIVYSIGAITYAIGSKKKGFHSIFHVFVVLAAIIQFVGICYLF